MRGRREIVTADVLRQAQADDERAVDLARRLSVSPAAISFAQARHGIYLIGRQAGVTRQQLIERNARVIALRQAGLLHKKIAHEVGVSRKHVGRILAASPASGAAE